MIFNDSTILDISVVSLLANSGDSGGDGGNIGIFYPGANTLSLGNLSATAESENGGNITVTNTATADVTIIVSGALDTNAAGELSGSCTITPSDTESNNITLTVNEGGDFYSVLSASGNDITFDSSAPVLVGLKTVVAQGILTVHTPTGGGTPAIAKAGPAQEPKVHEVGISVDGAPDIQVNEWEYHGHHWRNDHSGQYLDRLDDRRRIIISSFKQLHGSSRRLFE